MATVARRAPGQGVRSARGEPGRDQSQQLQSQSLQRPQQSQQLPQAFPTHSQMSHQASRGLPVHGPGWGPRQQSWQVQHMNRAAAQPAKKPRERGGVSRAGVSQVQAVQQPPLFWWPPSSPEPWPP